MMKIKLSTSYLFSVVLAFAVLLISAFWNNAENYRFFGVILAAISINFVFRCRNTKKMLLLFSIIAYINICVAVLDMLLMGELSGAYQHDLRYSAAGLTYAKAYLIMVSLMDLFITENFVEKCSELDDLKTTGTYNPLISFGAVVLSLVVTFAGFKGGGLGGYVSNDNPFYEYVVLFVIIGFFYAGENIKMRGLLTAAGCVYIVRGLLGGDRSSAFMMMLVLCIALLIKRLTVAKAIVWYLGGIVLANAVAVLRQSIVSASNLWDTLTSRGLLFFFSDTASASFYSGVTIVEYSGTEGVDRIDSMFLWLKELITGGINYTNITRLASEKNYNGGGGMFPSYFHLFAGMFGVIVATILCMWIIKKLIIGRFVVSELYTNVIIALVFRWYLYTPTSLFRTVFINFSIVVLVCYAFNRTFNKRSLQNI